MRKYEGKSMNEIAKVTGHDFRTVKKYIEKNDFNIREKPKRKRTGKLSPYEEEVKKWLTKDKEAPKKQRHTAKRVYERLKEKYPEKFDVSDRAVRNMVSRLKAELEVGKEGSIPLYHPPGEAQVDFGKARFVENGTTYDGHYINMSFPYSNGGYCQLFKSENQECLLEGMRAIFEHMGGVPKTIWFDNMSTAVKRIKKYGERDYTKGFMRFMMHHGFKSNFCNPDSGNEKGSVESKVGYHRRNLFVPIPEFKSLKEYNRGLLVECEKDMERIHYKKNEMIKDLYAIDKEHFLEMPKKRFEVFLISFAKTNNYGKVQFQQNTYSTSPKAAKTQVMIKATANEVEIFDKDQNIIVKHKRLYGQKKESMIWGPYLELMAKRPRALKYTDFFNELPDIIKDHIQSMNYESKKEFLQIIHKMSTHTNLENAVLAFKESLNRKVYDTDSIWALYCRLTSGKQENNCMKLPKNIPAMNEYDPQISKYDKLIPEGGISR